MLDLAVGDGTNPSARAVLTKGRLDDGRGRARVSLFRHKHEIESGRTSSVGIEVLGFGPNGQEVLPEGHAHALKEKNNEVDNGPTSATKRQQLSWEEIASKVREVTLSCRTSEPDLPFDFTGAQDYLFLGSRGSRAVPQDDSLWSHCHLPRLCPPHRRGQRWTARDEQRAPLSCPRTVYTSRCSRHQGRHDAAKCPGADSQAA